MTTKVIIQNHGPLNVVIRQKSPDGKQMNPLILVKPNEFKDSYIHAGQYLEIIEVSEDK